MPAAASRSTGDWRLYPQPSHLRSVTRSKDIPIFMDGTGKDGNLNPVGAHNPPTNVWRLLCR
ncbi:hypothetical protein RSAG8_13834, partial [Rhizoctonia solani AG-8 WAC10335]